jgi:hypothetical protein
MNDFQSTTDSVKYNASRLADQAASSINSALDDSQRKANEVIDGVRQTVPSALSKAAETADALARRGKRIAEIPKFLRADIKHRLAAATIRRDGNGRRIQEPTAKQPERLTVSAKIRRTKRQHDPAALQGVHVQRTTQPSNPLARFVRKEQTSAQL